MPVDMRTPEASARNSPATPVAGQIAGHAGQGPRQYIGGYDGKFARTDIPVPVTGRANGAHQMT